MCQIFLIPAGLMPDKDQFTSSVITNPHGWGMVEATGGELLYTFPSFEDGSHKENTDAVWEAVEGSKDVTRMVHMRYNTAGSTSLENAHPFTILDTEWGHPKNIAMSHNGTLRKFSPPINSKDTRSDTCVMVEEFMGPLFDAVIGAYPEKNPWEFDWVQRLMDEAAGTASKFCFLNGDGDYFLVNEKQGEWLDSGIWVANTYSFNKSHREPRVTTYSGYPRNHGVTTQKKGQEDWSTAGAPKISPNTHPSITPNTKSTTGTTTEGTSTTTIPKKSQLVLFKPELVTEKFSTRFNCSPRDLIFLDEDALADIIDQSTDDAILLIMQMQNMLGKQAVDLHRQEQLGVKLTQELKTANDRLEVLNNRLFHLSKTDIKTNVIPLETTKKEVSQ